MGGRRLQPYLQADPSMEQGLTLVVVGCGAASTTECMQCPVRQCTLCHAMPCHAVMMMMIAAPAPNWLAPHADGPFHACVRACHNPTASAEPL